NPATITRILLSHFNWDKEKLMERYFDGNLEKLFAECHVINPSKKSRTRQMNTRSSAQDMPCQICYLNYPNSYFTGLECGHKFCMQCWSEYLTTKIMEEGMGQTISCPAHGCDILVDDNTVMRLITDSKVKLKYQHLITNSFVECNRLLKWCPAPDCHHVVKVQYPDAKPVRCKCGRQFCFNCGENWHDPVKCKWLKKWIKKCDDDSETSNWIAANTKVRGSCHWGIGSRPGSHQCRARRVEEELRWVWPLICPQCRVNGAIEVWPTSFGEEAHPQGREEPPGRAALQRYLFYCNRYMNHMQSLRFEHKLYSQVKQKMEEMQQHNMSWIEVQFLKKAVDVLCQCRATLMYTYVFAFYLKKNNQSIIFENNQADLENATEVLSGYLERDISQDSLQDIKQKVQDKYRYCESRRRVLLQHVHEGYEKDLWEYIED
ncbi:E3 ubiquitin-protein ligase ARIH1, partial [Calypte anna]